MSDQHARLSPEVNPIEGANLIIILNYKL